MKAIDEHWDELNKITSDGSSQAKRHSRALVIIFRPNNLAA